MISLLSISFFHFSPFPFPPTGWELTFAIDLPALPARKVPLRFTHTASSAPASDIALDNLVVVGGVCGTGLACACPGFVVAPNVTTTNTTTNATTSAAPVSITTYAGKGNNALTGANDLLSMTETMSGAQLTAPGYAPYHNTGYMELPCSHCLVQSSSGAVYTRWGRHSCPSGHVTVYSGYMGGARDANAAGGADFLCLTSRPKFDVFSRVQNEVRNRI